MQRPSTFRPIRRGFTLVEVIGAVTAFTIAFLAGSAAFARLLQQQTVNYHRSLGSAAAMLLTDWHVDANNGNDLVTNIADGTPDPVVTSKPLYRLPSIGGQVRFKNADYVAGDDVCVFHAAASGHDLRLYGSLVVTISPPSAREADSLLTWRQMTMWYGSVEGVLNNRSTSLEFVGRYLVPDTHP